MRIDIDEAKWFKLNSDRFHYNAFGFYVHCKSLDRKDHYEHFMEHTSDETSCLASIFDNVVQAFMSKIPIPTSFTKSAYIYFHPKYQIYTPTHIPTQSHTQTRT